MVVFSNVKNQQNVYHKTRLHLLLGTSGPSAVTLKKSCYTNKTLQKLKLHTPFKLQLELII